MVGFRFGFVMKPFVLESSFSPAGQQPGAIAKLTKGFENGLFGQTLLGVTGSGKTFILANTIASLQRPAILLAPNKTLAAQLYGEMKRFFPQNAVEYFVSYYDYYQPEAYVASTDTFIEKDASVNEQIEQMRLSATKSILTRPDCIIVSTVSAIYGLGDPAAYLEMILHLQVGEVVNQRDVLRQLASLQYTRNDIELKRGTFRVKGEIIDIHPAESDNHAVRLELFDDEIDAIKLFDPLTGACFKSVERITIYPKTHYVTPKEKVKEAVELIKVELSQRLAYFTANGQLLEAQRLEQRTKHDLEMLQHCGFCNGVENYSRHFTKRQKGMPPPTLMDYLPKNALIIIDESHVTVSQIGGMVKGDQARKKNLVDYGFRMPSAADNRPLTFLEFKDRITQVVFVSATPGDYELNNSDQVVECLVRPTGLVDPLVEIRPATGQVEDCLGELRLCVKKKERALITTLTKKMSEQLAEYLQQQGVLVRYLHSDIDTVERVAILQDLRQGVFDVLVGINLLREGLDLPEVAAVFIFDADKEGFLRSKRSLIQTIGRAARHLNGRAILYADKVTKSMQATLAETDRRRSIQLDYNKKHKIVPRSVSKGVVDTLVSEVDVVMDHEVEDFSHYTAKQASSLIKDLEKAMYQAANELDFEEAKALRDKISLIEKQVFM